MGLFNRKKLSRLELPARQDEGLEALVEKRARLARTAIAETPSRPRRRIVERRPARERVPSRWRALRAADEARAREVAEAAVQDDGWLLGTTEPLPVVRPMSKRLAKLHAYPARAYPGRRRMMHGVPRGRGLVL